METKTYYLSLNFVYSDATHTATPTIIRCSYQDGSGKDYLEISLSNTDPTVFYSLVSAITSSCWGKIRDILKNDFDFDSSLYDIETQIFIR